MTETRATAISEGLFLLNHRSPRFFVFALCLLGLMPAWAQRGFEPPVSIQRERANLVINLDGSYREVAEQSVRIRTAPGVEQYASQEIGYILTPLFCPAVSYRVLRG